MAVVQQPAPIQFTYSGLEPNYWQLFDGMNGVLTWKTNVPKAVNLRISLENRIGAHFDVEYDDPHQRREMILYPLDHAQGAESVGKIWFVHEVADFGQGEEDVYNMNVEAKNQQYFDILDGVLTAWGADVLGYDAAHPPQQAAPGAPFVAPAPSPNGQVGGRKKKSRKPRRKSKKTRKTRRHRI